MASRAGMNYVIKKLRGETDTSVDAYAVNEVYYWTDEQLQDILDGFRSDVLDVALRIEGLYDDEVLSYTRYYMPKSLRFLETDDTTGAFSIIDSNGTAAPTNTIDYEFGLVTFAADTSGTQYYIRGRQYSVIKAAAKVWGMKAAHRAELIHWKGGGYTLAEDQEWEHCMAMEKYYSGFDGIGVTRLVRTGYSAQAGG